MVGSTGCGKVMLSRDNVVSLLGPQNCAAPLDTLRGVELFTVANGCVCLTNGMAWCRGTGHFVQEYHSLAFSLRGRVGRNQSPVM